MSIKIKIDASAIAAQFKDIKSQIEKDIQDGIKALSTITHAKIVEMAHTELHSSQKQYIDSLNIESISENVHVISLDENALWIEEGTEAGKDMKPGLLKGSTKTSKSGDKYRVIPFNHSKNPSGNTESTQNLINQIKTALDKKKISFKEIERHPNGSPKLGKLHTLNIKSDIPGKGNTHALKGVNIYQSQDSTGKVRRDVMTFRTVSSGASSNNKWIYPGIKSKHFFERAEEFCNNVWENQILPEILSKYK